MIIKDGYDGKPTTIEIMLGRDRMAEIYIIQAGISDKETLGYITIDEMLDLKDELDRALLKIIDGALPNDGE